MLAEVKKRSLALAFALICTGAAYGQKSYSGIYPSLAMYNNEGECGTGAVMPWNDKLYVITYAPHQPIGSSDKLYIVNNDKTAVTYDKSVGGTPANRMIHKESGKMFIGPYIVDGAGNIVVSLAP